MLSFQKEILDIEENYNTSINGWNVVHGYYCGMDDWLYCFERSIPKLNIKFQIIIGEDTNKVGVSVMDSSTYSNFCDIQLEEGMLLKNVFSVANGMIRSFLENTAKQFSD